MDGWDENYRGKGDHALREQEQELKPENKRLPENEREQGRKHMVEQGGSREQEAGSWEHRAGSRKHGLGSRG